MLITVAVAVFALGAANESAAHCGRLPEQSAAVRALLDQEWWTLDLNQVAKVWFDPLDRIGCGSVEGTCAELIGGKECGAIFFFTAPRKGGRFTLGSFSLMPAVPSLTAATAAADELWASIPLPPEACPSANARWGASELSRSCSWFADSAKFDVAIRIDTLEGGYELGLDVMRGPRK